MHVPSLVERILGTRVEPCNLTDDRKWRWAHLRTPSARQKLLFAVLSAQDDGAWGLVAIKDGDKRPVEVRKSLQDAKEFVKVSKGIGFPVAIGCPNPHADAWLLDDQEAVRSGLSLDSTHAIPVVKPGSYPKRDIDALVKLSPNKKGRTEYDLLSAVASDVKIERCPHAQETGFKAFREDVRSEFTPLLKSIDKANY